MAFFEVSIIVATFAGPVFAVQAQKWIERIGAAKDRRQGIFKALMATRGAILSPRHVEALNMIDLEFKDDEFRDVQEAWNSYRDHLNTRTTDETATQIWAAKREDLLAALLSAMGRALRYRFSDVDLRKGWYNPQQHFNDEQEQRQLRALLLKAFQSGALTIEAPAQPSQPSHLPRLKGS